MHQPLNIGFVCQRGRLEAQACVLAASLRHYLPGHIRLFAGIPGGTAGTDAPLPGCTTFLKGLGVELATLQNPIAPTYPIGNKLACLQYIEQPDAHALFLDSDMLTLANFYDLFAQPHQFLAKPADFANSGISIEAWNELLRSHHIAPTGMRTLTTHDRTLTHPYFNAGFIGVAGRLALGKSWIEHARKIVDGQADIPHHLDQIALGIAVQSRNPRVTAVSDHFNFPAHLKPIEPDNRPAIVHYHNAAHVGASAECRAEVDQLLERSPSLYDILANDPEWDWVRRDGRVAHNGRQGPERRAYQSRNFVITGIPRSGTSLFCSYAEQLVGTIVLNEPAEIFPALQKAGDFGLAKFYERTRYKILQGDPIASKIDETGRIISDTKTEDVRRPVVYDVDTPAFNLGTKNTLAYLARLEQIAYTMPSAQIVAIVRNPLDTIASWIQSFSHLRDALPGNKYIGTPSDTFLSGRDRDALREIAQQSDPAVRRALRWNFLARRIIQNRDRIHLIRYEEMVGNPIDCLRALLGTLEISEVALEKVAHSIRRSEAMQRRNCLSSHEIDTVRAICSSTAKALGYPSLAI